MTDIEMTTLKDAGSARTEPFIIEGWLVEPSANLLHCLESGEQRSLEPRLMHLLCLLASAPGTVLTRDYLISQIWPKVIVNENSLTRAVSELRKKLELQEASKRLIDTIPKTGYRLSADCKVRDYLAGAIKIKPQESTSKTLGHEAVLPSLWQKHSRLWTTGAIAFVATVVVALQGFLFNPDSNSLSAPLADINLSSSDALSSLIRGGVEKVATSNSSKLGASATDSGIASNQAVVSRDGRLFAMIHYSDEGSSLLLGSTDLPNSPIAVLSTQDTLYNLQWSPIDRVLLFAQAPRVTPAALLPEQQASLVMFDIDSFTTRVIQGPDLNDDNTASKKSSGGGFKLTSLSKRFDWLS